MRLILQDGDSKRGLRLKDGTFSIGSAADCKITLESEGVAEHHADLVVTGSEVKLVALSAEHPVLVGGDPIEGASVLKSGQLFSIGAARFKLDMESKYSAGKAPAKAPAARTVRSAVAKPERVERSARRPRGNRSLPG